MNINSMVKTKKRLMEDMNDIIRFCVLDEDLIDVWLMGGIPDGADSYDYEDFATDKELFNETCKLFARLVDTSMKHGDFE